MYIDTIVIDYFDPLTSISFRSKYDQSGWIWWNFLRPRSLTGSQVAVYWELCGIKASSHMMMMWIWNALRRDFFFWGGVADVPVRGIPGLFEQSGGEGWKNLIWNLWLFVDFPRWVPVSPGSRATGHNACRKIWDEFKALLRPAFWLQWMVVVICLMFVLHPWKSTRNLKTTSLKRKIIFQPSMFGFNMLIFQGVYIFFGWVHPSKYFLILLGNY